MPQHPVITDYQNYNENIPLQPIVSFTDTTTYGLAKELSLLLKPLLGKSKHHLETLLDFASSISHELRQTDETIVSFDVVSLFTKIPIELALNIAKQHLQSNPEYKFVNYRPNRTWKHGTHYKQVFETIMIFPSHQ